MHSLIFLILHLQREQFHSRLFSSLPRLPSASLALLSRPSTWDGDRSQDQIMEPLASKFLPPIIQIEELDPLEKSIIDSESDSSDDETETKDKIDLSFLLGRHVNSPDDDEPFFVIDSNPASKEDMKLEKKLRYQCKSMSKLTLDPGRDTSGLLKFEKPADAINFMGKSSSAEAVYGAKSLTIQPDFNKVDQTTRPVKVSRRLKKKINRQKAAETAGDKWFNVPATEMTQEIKNDIKILQMRDALDPKRHYKRNNDLAKRPPKYFHVGKFVAPAADYYNSLPRKQRKQTIVDELLADADWQRRQKTQFARIIKSNPKYVRMARRKQVKVNMLKNAKKAAAASSSTSNLDWSIESV